MKLLLVVLAVFSAGVSAAPESAESRFVDDIIIGVINDAIQSIQDSGLDPLYIPHEEASIKLPVTDLFSAQGQVTDLLVEGLSNIRINNIRFAILTTRLTFDVSLPGIGAHIGSATAAVQLGDYVATASGSGTFVIRDIRVAGTVRVSIGVISGISIRDLAIDFSVGNVESNLNVVILDKDISQPLNNLLGETIPNFLNEHSADINTLLEYLVEKIIENLL